MTPFERRTLINELKTRGTWTHYGAVMFVQATCTMWSGPVKLMLDQLVSEGIATVNKAGDVYTYVEKA